MPNIQSYGFIELADIYSQRLIEVDAQTIQDAVRRTLEEYNRVLNELMSAMVEPTSEYKIRYRLPNAGTLQPLDEKGIPKPVVPGGFYDIAFPIQGGGTAWGDNRVSRAMMTVEDMDRILWGRLTEDSDWMIRHILAAWFTNTTWTYTDDKHGALTIQPLANGDSVPYMRSGGLMSTDNHFLAQANAIGDANNPFPTIYSELDEHPSNTGPYVAFIASNLVASCENLAAMVEVKDTALEYGANVTTLALSQDIDTTGRGGAMTAFGDRLIGRANGVYVVEWKRLPDDYIVFHAAGVNDALGMRQYDVPELQGLIPEFNSVNGNLHEHRLLRYAGFGAKNRVAAGAMRIGNASYAIPTGFAAPLAV